MLEGEPDRVPLWELTVQRDVKSAFLGRRINTMEDEIEFWTTAGYEHVPLSVGLRTIVREQYRYLQTGGVSTAVRKRMPGHLMKAKYSVFTDELQERQWAEEKKGVIASIEDFESFPWPTAEELDYSPLENASGYLPQGMKAIAIVGYAFTPVWTLMGFETFAYALAENPGLVERMFEKVGSLTYEIVKIASTFPSVGAIMMPDDLAYSHSLMIAPRHFRKYLFPWYKRISTDICKPKNLPYVFHSDGKLDAVMDDLVDCGFNAIHPFEPKCMDLAENKKKYGHKICLLGNIDLHYTLTLGSPQEVEEETKLRIKQAAPGGGFACGSANSVTEYVPLANYNAMRETVLKYGTYPINIP